MKNFLKALIEIGVFKVIYYLRCLLGVPILLISIFIIPRQLLVAFVREELLKK